MGIALIWLGYSLWSERRGDTAGLTVGHPAAAVTN